MLAVETPLSKYIIEVCHFLAMSMDHSCATLA